jgi:hypothetical protein
MSEGKFTLISKEETECMNGHFSVEMSAMYARHWRIFSASAVVLLSFICVV